jgi:hypothetical protein
VISFLLCSRESDPAVLAGVPGVLGATPRLLDGSGSLEYFFEADLVGFNLPDDSLPILFAETGKILLTFRVVLSDGEMDVLLVRSHRRT